MLCKDGLKVASPNVRYAVDAIEATYEYNTTAVREGPDGELEVAPEKHTYEFKTSTKVPKLGVMLVGWGGNNGTTVTAGIIANREDISWKTKVSDGTSRSRPKCAAAAIPFRSGRPIASAPPALPSDADTRALAHRRRASRGQTIGGRSHRRRRRAWVHSTAPRCTCPSVRFCRWWIRTTS